MKKITAILLCLTLLAAAGTGWAEETTEYRDSAYSFRYPSNWTLRYDYDGSVILELPGTASSIITYAVLNSVLVYTGDEETDRAMAETAVSGYTEENALENGKHTVLNGTFDLIEHDGMHGFRAYGTWLLSGEDLVMILLTGKDHLVAFQLNGPDAIAMEDELLDSVELLGSLDSSDSGDGKHWDCADYSLDYPAHYGLTESTTGVMLANPDGSGNVMAARAYDIDFDYSDDMASQLASQLLPKSAKIDAEPVLEQIGGRTTAVIRGSIDSGNLAFYLFGGGRKIFVLLVVGDEAISLADDVVASVELK